MLKIGNNLINKIYIGNSFIDKVAVGYSARNLPYLCELEYLESTGTEMINTGIVFSAEKDCKISACVMNLHNNRSIIASSYKDDYSQSISLEFGGTSNSKAGYLRGYLIYRSNDSTSSFWSSTDLPLNIKLNVAHKWIASTKTQELTYNGTTETKVRTTVPAFSETSEIKLFLDNRANNSAIAYPVRIYDLQIEVDNELVRDFIPVLDYNRKACMYDKVSGKLFYNQGTGSFNYAMLQ